MLSSKIRATILWADDEIDLLEPHILYLQNKGYSVTPVPSGEDAIQLCDENDYDLVLLDEMMTGLDGLTTLNPNIVEKNRAIEVDIKREIAISKADINGVTSEEIKGKVMNKKDKLKALRNKRK